jgi:NAD(P)-dependent dehydrogenase (short-subunit alcohol dehydrogenase family)
MAQVWLITGSARGLGRAIAEAVLAAGDKLIATARNPQQLSHLVERYGDHVRAVALYEATARVQEDDDDCVSGHVSGRPSPRRRSDL